MKRINIYSLKQVKEKGALYNIDSKKITSPKEAYSIINTVLDLENEAVEKFGILSLTTKNEIAGIHIISVGSLNTSIVHPREVFKAAIMNNSSALILFHNHPSGDPTSSREDIEVTKRLTEAGKILGIDVLDHVIIGEDKYFSLKDKGLI